MECDPAFFVGICQFPNFIDFAKSLDTMISSDINVLDIYVHRVYVVAHINEAKYRHLKKGMIFSILALVVLLTLIGYLFEYYLGSGAIPR